MKKSVWCLILSTFAMGTQVFAATVSCPLSQTFNFDRTSATINNFNDTQTIANTTGVGALGRCNDQAAVRSNFQAASGSSNLTATGSGSYPFGVDTNIVLNGSTANAAIQNLAKIWLSDNLKLSFNLRDDVSTTPVEVKQLDTDYNVHPNTSKPGRVMINGEEYLRAEQGIRNAGMSVPNLGIALINKTVPSLNIINALNGSTIRIHFGTLTYKYDNYHTRPPTGVPKIASTELYLNLKLVFARPTCTMSNQTVNLAPASTSILNTDQTANQQSFNISFDCSVAMSGNTVLARVTDNYTPNNNNNNGILKNQPSLANKSNVDVQLLDEADQPLAIGMQHSFYNVPADSTATSFIKTLKARYYRSQATAKPGYVQTQATVFLDYQ
ncbi:fimbrial protein [Acinetobacter guillouiae]|uniref:fimbrial protein n=1 Tax=Acinetobacter guillouiae TaxID=106649 RepID=UPI001FD974F1|nr:fimbrial protein [Acinetobacter guillouiae]MBP2544065.1 hypothetical protein [Acinetobacter guillouiae]